MALPEFTRLTFKHEPGKAYAPSNATEFDLFYSQVCETCTKDDDGHCPIIMHSMVFEITDEQYPKEWVINNNGNPTCTGYLDKDDVDASKSLASYRCKETTDLFNTNEDD